MKYIIVLLGLLFASLSLCAQQGSTNQQLAESYDADYDARKTDKVFLLNYIEKRTTANLNNADIIDQYIAIAPHQDILKSITLALLLNEKQQLNANGAFFQFILAYKQKIKSNTRLSNEQIDNVLANAVAYTFEKACNTNNETLLNAVIEARLAYAPVNEEKETMVRNEYRTKFYYETKQPAMLSTTVLAYANTLMNQEQQDEDGKANAVATNEKSVNQKALFPTSARKTIQNKELFQDAASSSKLRNAAQYVVEMLSNKTMLNNALSWSQRSIELFDDSNNYKTHAYILYKLGKRNEAIAYMEKAYSSSADDNQKEVSSNLIKMKRGERIW